MEKTQQFVAGIEGFDSTKLKKTETNEKNPLPDKDGKLLEEISYQMSNEALKNKLICCMVKFRFFCFARNLICCTIFILNFKFSL